MPRTNIEKDCKYEENGTCKYKEDCKHQYQTDEYDKQKKCSNLEKQIEYLGKGGYI